MASIAMFRCAFAGSRTCECKSFLPNPFRNRLCRECGCPKAHAPVSKEKTPIPSIEEIGNAAVESNAPSTSQMGLQQPPASLTSNGSRVLRSGTIVIKRKQASRQRAKVTSASSAVPDQSMDRVSQNEVKKDQSSLCSVTDTITGNGTSSLTHTQPLQVRNGLATMADIVFTNKSRSPCMTKKDCRSQPRRDENSELKLVQTILPKSSATYMEHIVGIMSTCDEETSMAVRQNVIDAFITGVPS